MGNEKLYSLAKVRQVFNMILTHESQFIDFTVPGIFSDSPCEQAYEVIKSNFLERIDWTKIELRKNPRHENLLDNASRSKKSKVKEKEKGSIKKKPASEEYFDKLNAVAQFILEYTADYNNSRSLSLGINSITWARICKDLMQHGKIFNSGKLDSYVCRGILFTEMLNAYKSLDLEKHLTEGEEPWIQINPKRTQLMLLQFLGQLCKTNQKKSAEVIHNFLHLGFLAAQHGKNCKNIALTLTPALLDGLDFSGYIRGKEDGEFTPEELIPFAKLIEVFLHHPIFSKPFNEKKYRKYNQPDERYEAKLSQSKEILWQTVIDNPSEHIEDHHVNEETEKEKISPPRVSRLKLFGHHFGSKRALNAQKPSPVSPKNSPKTSPNLHSSKKGSRILPHREMSTQADENPNDKSFFMPSYENDKRRNIHFLGEDKKNALKMFHTFQDLTIHEREKKEKEEKEAKRKRAATMTTDPTVSEDDGSLSSFTEPAFTEVNDVSDLSTSAAIPTRKKNFK